MVYEEIGLKIIEVIGMWIKCSDRLPSLHEKVLCVNDDGEIWVAYMLDDLHGGYEFCEPLDYCYIGKVTHWMPLPELPKEEL